MGLEIEASKAEIATPEGELEIGPEISVEPIGMEEGPAEEEAEGEKAEGAKAEGETAAGEKAGKEPQTKPTPDPRDAWKKHFEERSVETGIASLSHIQILAGLTEGDEVALEDPTRPKKKENGR